MGVFFKNGSVIEVANECKTEAVAIQKFSGGEKGSANYSESLPKNSLSKCAIELYVDSNNPETITACYKSAIKIAEEKQISSLAIPLLGAGNQNLDIDDVWKLASNVAYHDDFNCDLYIAIDTTANKRIEAQYPPLQSQRNEYEWSHTFGGAPQGSTFFAMENEKGYVPNNDRIEDLPITNVKAVADAFNQHLVGDKYYGKYTIADIRRATEGFLDQNTVKNVLLQRYDGDVTKRSIVILAIAMGMSVDDLDDVLYAGGYVFGNIREDEVFTESINRGYDLDQTNIYLFREECAPFSRKKAEREALERQNKIDYTKAADWD